MPNEHLRVSDEERERAVEVLGEALRRGMLDIHEFEERSQHTMTARTRGELSEIFADLPLDGGIAVPVEPETLELTGTFVPHKYKGQWEVPQQLVIRKNFGSTELDFTNASVKHPVVDIVLQINCGSVEMRVPDEAHVDLSRVELVMASAEDHRRTKPADGRPTFRVTGAMRMGSIEVRGRPWRPFARKAP